MSYIVHRWSKEGTILQCSAVSNLHVGACWLDLQAVRRWGWAWNRCQKDGRLSPMYLNDVRDHIDQSLTRELPYNVPFKAKVSFIRKFKRSRFERVLQMWRSEGSDISEAARSSHTTPLCQISNAPVPMCLRRVWQISVYHTNVFFLFRRYVSSRRRFFIRKIRISHARRPPNSFCLCIPRSPTVPLWFTALYRESHWIASIAPRATMRLQVRLVYRDAEYIW
ncbi:hypothetical protein BXZ70DRAFT_471273 [Cristinia sonorae]|uniref:Uncharacterized protein n=1 Tax=Cristinia sonorae TaxID=1940300 RepID=A0A8K0UI96_9AGAR|nr:hypothetical protein BXZ70DRAFT_471273 [Cristinia sonorae]